MRLLVDECTGPAVAAWLREQGFDVYSVFDDARGMTDHAILAKAGAEKRILITNDKDFGEMVFREQIPHRGVVLLRLQDARAASKIAALERLLSAYANRLADAFVVVTETTVRIN